MSPWGPEDEPDIIGTPDRVRVSRRRRRYTMAGGVLALAGLIAAASISAARHSPASHKPAGAIPHLPPPVPGPAPSQTWVAALDIANWPMPGSGSSSMFAGGVAAHTGWELTLRNFTRSGQRCAAAVVLSMFGPQGRPVMDVYPVSPRPASRTPVGNVAFIALGAKSPGAGVGVLQLGTPAQQAWADPGRIGGSRSACPS
jgi:hypothetical protein